jgi:hypothetical protein
VRRLVLVGVVGVAVILGCGGSGSGTETVDGTGGGGGTSTAANRCIEAAASDAGDTVVGLWFPCCDETCSSADVEAYDGWQFTDDGSCYGLTSPNGSTEFCSDGSPGDCTYDGEIVTILITGGSEDFYVELGVSVHGGVLTIESLDTDAPPLFHVRVPDSLTGACRASGEPCQSDAECGSRLCSCESEPCDQPVCY